MLYSKVVPELRYLQDLYGVSVTMNTLFEARWILRSGLHANSNKSGGSAIVP